MGSEAFKRTARGASRRRACQPSESRLVFLGGSTRLTVVPWVRPAPFSADPPYRQPTNQARIPRHNQRTTHGRTSTHTHFEFPQACPFTVDRPRPVRAPHVKRACFLPWRRERHTAVQARSDMSRRSLSLSFLRPAPSPASGSRCSMVTASGEVSSEPSVED